MTVNPIYPCLWPIDRVIRILREKDFVVSERAGRVAPYSVWNALVFYKLRPLRDYAASEVFSRGTKWSSMRWFNARAMR